MVKTNDHYALAQLREGALTVNADTGVVYLRGKPVTSRSVHGYVRFSLPNGKQVLAHRVVWLAVHGPIANGLVINHRNRRRDDNRIVNLEAVSVQQNVLHSTGSLAYAGIRPEDLEAVDPLWLADMLQRAARGDGPPDRGSGPAEFRINRNGIKYAI
jgi:hypothetical protein